MHHVFIVNPVAGKSRAYKMIDKIKDRFENFDQAYEIRITEAPGHAKKIAQESVLDNRPVRLYSVGGDGTLNEVLNGMAGSHAELGIIPCGSGNDAVRSFYNCTDPVELIKVLPTSPSALVDLGKFNDRYFINIASIGFDAEVVLKSRLFRKFPLLSGPMTYVLGVLAAIISLKKYRLKITIDDSLQVEKDFLLTIFANGSYYGGGMKASPTSKIDDGLLDFSLVDMVSRLKLMKFFPAFKKGEHLSMKEVFLTKGVRAVVESDKPFPLNIDGEVFTDTHASIELLPEALSVIIPSP